jgi:hypothetical protein
VLATASETVFELEPLQQSVEVIANQQAQQSQQEVREFQEQMVRTNKKLADMLSKSIYELGNLKGPKP